jgi:hypothetical protein
MALIWVSVETGTAQSDPYLLKTDNSQPGATLFFGEFPETNRRRLEQSEKKLEK